MNTPNLPPYARAAGRAYQYLMYFLAGVLFLVVGGVALLIPNIQRSAERAEQTRQVALLSADLDATVFARLTLIARELDLQGTATAYLDNALSAARTQAIATEAALSSTLFAQTTQIQADIARTATAAPQLTQQVLIVTASAAANQQAGATALAEQVATATATAIFATRVAQVATISAAETALVEVDAARRATAEAILAINSTREAALRAAAALDPKSAANLSQLAVFRHGAPLTDLELSADGNLAAAISGATVVLWDVRGGKLIRSLNHAGLTVNGIAFSPDGKRLAAAVDDGSVWLWNTDAQSSPLIKQVHRQPVFRVAFSADGTLLGSAGGDQAVIWESATLRLLAELPGGAWEVSFSPLGRTVFVSGADGVLRVWGVPLFGASVTPSATPKP